MLLERNDVNPDTVDKSGRTPFSWAVGKQDRLPNGINPHTTNEECRTPFPWIVEQDTGPPDVAEGCGL